MRFQTGFVIAALALAACKKTKSEGQPPPDPTPGSSSGKPTEGSGSAAVAGSAAGSDVPPSVPLAGEGLAKFYVACLARINAGKLDDYKRDCIDPEIAVHDVDSDEFTGADSVIGYYTDMRKAMPDFKLEPQLVLVSGRNILAITLMTGKQTGPLKAQAGELKASDKTVGMLTLHHVKTNDDNKATEEWEYSDNKTMLGQLGLLPKEQGATRAPLAAAAPPIVLVTKDDAKETSNLDLVHKGDDAFNAHKSGDLVALWADDANESDQASDKDNKGKAAIEGNLKGLFSAFPDVKIQVPNAFAAGDYVIVEGKLTGTHKGALGPIKPTNKQVEISYAEVFKVKDGKIAEVTRFRNDMAMAAQLGLLGETPKDAPKDAPKAPPKQTPKDPPKEAPKGGW